MVVRTIALTKRMAVIVLDQVSEEASRIHITFIMQVMALEGSPVKSLPMKSDRGHIHEAMPSPSVTSRRAISKILMASSWESSDRTKCKLCKPSFSFFSHVSPGLY